MATDSEMDIAEQVEIERQVSIHVGVWAGDIRSWDRPQFIMASEVEQAQSLGENGGGDDSCLLEQAVIERRNLLNIVKLTVKVLIESAMRKGQPMDDSDKNLQQLFTAIEHSLRHRLKGLLLIRVK